MGNDIEGDLLGELLWPHRLVHEDTSGLVEQLVHGVLARAAGRLIGRHHHPADPGQIMQWLQGQHHLDRGAVRVGDDVALTKSRKCLGIDLRDHQRHVRIHAIVRGVVDDHSPRFGRPRRILGRHLGARRREQDLGPFEVKIGQILHLEDVFFAE